MLKNIDYTIDIAIVPESVCTLLDRLVDVCIDAAAENTFKAYADATSMIMTICGEERYRITKMMDKRNLLLLSTEE